VVGPPAMNPCMQFCGSLAPFEFLTQNAMKIIDILCKTIHLPASSINYLWILTLIDGHLYYSHSVLGSRKNLQLPSHEITVLFEFHEFFVP